MSPPRIRRRRGPGEGGAAAALEPAPPPEGLRFELVPLAKLLPHEEIEEEDFRRLVVAMREEGTVREPLLVAEGHFVVLNGHHRFAALRALGLTHAPAWVVDYFSDLVELEKWPRSPFPGPVSKAEVVRRARARSLFPPKTTRHRLKVAAPPRSTALDELR